MTLGEIIRKNRKRKGLTQSELGSHVRVTDVQISKYEKDKATPSFSKMKIIAKILEIEERQYVDFYESTIEIPSAKSELDLTIQKLNRIELTLGDSRLLSLMIQRLLDDPKYLAQQAELQNDH